MKAENTAAVEGTATEPAAVTGNFKIYFSKCDPMYSVHIMKMSTTKCHVLY
jgi:hypothetical protein